MAKQKSEFRYHEQGSSKASRKLSPRKTSSNRPKLEAVALNPLTEILRRFRLRLIEEASRIAGNREINALDLEQAYERLLSSHDSEQWSVVNRRRVFLIQKQLAGDITSDESSELKELQAKADRHMHEVAPRPLEELWDLKRKLSRE